MLTGEIRLKRLAARCAALAATASGFTSWRRRRRRERGECGVYILEYHAVTTDLEEPEGEVHQDRFAAHLSWLAERYRMVSLVDTVQMVVSGEGLERDAIAITFDDGYLNNYEVAWPVLRQNGLSATFFLTTDFLDGGGLWFDVARRALNQLRGQPASSKGDLRAVLRNLFGPGWASSIGSVIARMKDLPGTEREALVERLAPLTVDAQDALQPMTWEQARELGGEGAELGCHTCTHPILSRVDESRQRREIEHSRKRIEEEMGTTCNLFAYPNGSARDFDDRTVAILQTLGFAAACTTIRGCNSRGQNPLELRRIGIGADSASLLDARLAGLFDDGVRRRLTRERVAA